MSHAFGLSTNVASLRESATIAVSSRAKELRASGRSVIDLGAGEPDTPTPGFVVHAAIDALQRGATRYTQVEGILPLRAAIADEANRRYLGRDRVTPTEVVVTTGTKQALFNACYTLFDAGDEVLVPTPAWTSYPEMIALARATPVAVYGRPDNDLKVTAEEVAAAATSKTRAIIVNSPCNPTGSVYSVDELRSILDVAIRRGWWVLSDEIYQRLAYDVPAPSILDVTKTRDRVMVFNGVAKAFAMTGWRIGWAIGPAAVVRGMVALQSHTTSNATTVSQHAALAALGRHAEADRAVAELVDVLRTRRDGVSGLLRSAGIQFVHPSGAFYAFIRVSRNDGIPDAGSAFARNLLEQRDIAVVPGAAFGASEWIRMSFAAPTDDVMEGTRRIIRALS